LGYLIELESTYLKKDDKVLNVKLVSEEKKIGIYELFVERVTQVDGGFENIYQKDNSIKISPNPIIVRPGTELPFSIKMTKKEKDRGYYRLVVSEKEKKKAQKAGITVKIRKAVMFEVEGTNEIKKAVSAKILKKDNKIFVTIKNNSSVKEDLHGNTFTLSYKHNSKKNSLNLTGNNLSPNKYIEIYPLNSVKFEIPWPKDLPKDATNFKLTIK